MKFPKKRRRKKHSRAPSTMSGAQKRRESLVLQLEENWR